MDQSGPLFLFFINKKLKKIKWTTSSGLGYGNLLVDYDNDNTALVGRASAHESLSDIVDR